MLEFRLENGKVLVLDDQGDQATINVQLFDENGELEDETNWSADSVSDMLFED